MILGALALRVVQLNVQPLWWDEGYSVFFATRDFPTLLARTAIDIHPPLYYALLQLWLTAFGKSDIALRLLSVVVGIAAIPLIDVVARQLFNKRTGLLAAFLLAMSPLHIYYSQEVRMYALVTLLGLASVALQLEIVNSSIINRQSSVINRRWGLWLLVAGYVMVTAAAVYTQYYAGFLLVAEIVVVLYLKFRARAGVSLKMWLTAWTAVALLYLPWVIYAGGKLYTYVTSKVGIEQYSRLDPLTFLAQHLAAFSIGHVSQFNWLVGGAAIYLAIAAIGVYLVSSKQGAGSSPFILASCMLLTAVYFLIPLLLGFLVNLVYTFHPIRYERLLLFAAPFFLILVAWGILRLWESRRVLGVAAVALVTILSVLSLYDFYTIPRYPDEDYRPLVQEIESLAQPHDLILALYPWQIGYLETYYHGAPLDVVEAPSDEWIDDSVQMSRALAELRAAHARVWLIAYQTKGRLLEDRLTNEFINDYVIADDWFGNTRLEYFALASSMTTIAHTIQYAPDLSLDAFGASSSPLKAGSDVALIQLHWRARSDAYNYSIRLLDGAGATVAQQDAPIPSGVNTIRRGLPIPRDIESREYRLALIVYPRATGAPMPTLEGTADVELARVVVTGD